MYFYTITKVVIIIRFCKTICIILAYSRIDLSPPTLSHTVAALLIELIISPLAWLRMVWNIITVSCTRASLAYG